MKTTKLSKDNFGDRMKMYENQCTGDVLIPKLPVVVRLDGKSFSSFTRGLKRPYDERLSNLMVETTKYLVKENNFNCGYTQSDEISLVWYFPDDVTQVPYGGKRFKLISDLAAQATLFFNKKLAEYLPEKKDKWPRFDCRVWNLPTLEEAVNCFVWREMDATKNSISMASQAFYSHKELNNKNGSEKQEMLFQKGINWNDYPAFFKRGTYIQRQRRLTKFSTEELEKLPARHNAKLNPDLEIERWVIERVDMPVITKVSNRVDVIIFGKDVETYE